LSSYNPQVSQIYQELPGIFSYYLNIASKEALYEASNFHFDLEMIV
jgi:hypothetical protein